MICSKVKGLCRGWDNIGNKEDLISDEITVCRFLSTMAEGIALNEVIYDGKGEAYDIRILKINKSFEKVTGLKAEAVVGKTLKEVVPDIEERWIKSLSEVVIKGNNLQIEDYCSSLKKYFKINTCCSENNKFFTLLTDITEVKKIEELSKKYQLINENARDIILFIREDGRIIEVNKAAVEAYGYEYEELISMNINHIRATNFDCVMPTYVKEDFCKGIVFETIHKRKDGSTFSVEVSSKGTEFNGEYILLDVVRDVTARKEAEEKLHKLAYYDPVTDLPNKQYFSEYIIKAIEEAAKKGEKLAVLFIDLDRYKKVNDTMGHLVGDRLLRGAADRLKTLIDDSVFAARVGGDEFIFVQSHINSQEEVSELAYKILNAIKEPFNFGGEEIHITTSIGISIYPAHGEDAMTLMKNADMSMYRVKNSGRNNYEFYVPSVNREAYEQLVIENNLHHALENSELILYYQPKFNAITGKIVGMEALVRWKNPKLGLVPPGKFIALAEETGLIVPIGRWVLETACQQVKAWQKSGLSPMRVAVNLSVRQFEEDDLIKLVEDVLNKTGLEPEYLELEITETMAVKNMDLIVKTLKRLRNMGIHIALDDFGTGYSSLKYLRNIPIDTVKIDRSFINDINSNSSYGAIIDVIIEIAKKLKLGIIAEGVETKEQSQFLIDKNCYEMQGYLFSKPVTKEEFEKMIESFS